MAFAVTGLHALSPGKSFNIFVYDTADNASVVETASYFDTVATTFDVKDLIFADMGDAQKIYRVDSITAGVVAITERLELAAPETAIADYDITWTTNEPTAADSATIADGATPTVVETGQFIADATAKLNFILAALRSHGIVAG